MVQPLRVAPILEELNQEVKGRAKVLKIEECEEYSCCLYDIVYTDYYCFC